MNRFKKSVIVLVVIAGIVLAACSYLNKKTVPQTISNFSSTVKGGVQEIASGSRNSVPLNSETVQYYFPRAGQKPEPVLVNIIDSAKSNVDMAIYSFTDKDIANALISAKKRGVTVRVISDRECSQEKSQKTVLDSLKNKDIPVKINSHTGIMHLKVTIADKNITTTGSFNYTHAAETENDEVFVVLDDPKIASNFDGEFTQMWDDTQNYKNF